MKRLFFVVCAIVLLLSQGIAFPQTADAAAAIRALDTNSLIGMSVGTLKAKYGSPARIEPSEYSFQWYVYNRDLKNFFMAGVRDGVVVACYSNAKTLNYKKQYKLLATRAAVRKKMGTPISYIRSGNTVCVLNNTNQKDIFTVGGNYVIVFYDIKKSTKVTSMMILPQADEDAALLGHPEMTGALIGAYQRIEIDLINAIRVRSGYRKLAVNTQNANLALQRSTDMRDRDYFDHYTPAPEKLSPAVQAKKLGIKYKSLGENISYGDHNAILAHEAFMNSSGHRANILKSSYTKIGAGVAYGGSRYVILTTIYTR
jgi:hypothetical protein